MKFNTIIKSSIVAVASMISTVAVAGSLAVNGSYHTGDGLTLIPNTNSASNDIELTSAFFGGRSINSGGTMPAYKISKSSDDGNRKAYSVMTKDGKYYKWVMVTLAKQGDSWGYKVTTPQYSTQEHMARRDYNLARYNHDWGYNIHKFSIEGAAVNEQPLVHTRTVVGRLWNYNKNTGEPKNIMQPIYVEASVLPEGIGRKAPIAQVSFRAEAEKMYPGITSGAANWKHPMQDTGHVQVIIPWSPYSGHALRCFENVVFSDEQGNGVKVSFIWNPELPACGS